MESYYNGRLCDYVVMGGYTNMGLGLVVAGRGRGVRDQIPQPESAPRPFINK